MHESSFSLAYHDNAVATLLADVRVSAIARFSYCTFCKSYVICVNICLPKNQ